MSSGCYLPDTWPFFTGLPLVSWTGSPNQPYPVDPWLSAWGSANAGVPIAWFGTWPGDPRQRPMWPHGFTVTMGVIALYYWDMILGDHMVIGEFGFNSCRGVLAQYSGAIGVFPPYL